MSDHDFFVYWSIVVPLFLFILFLPMEIAGALKNDKVDTLSAWVWSLIGTRQGWNWRTTPGRLGVLILFLWLAEHFTFGWI